MKMIMKKVIAIKIIARRIVKNNGINYLIGTNTDLSGCKCVCKIIVFYIMKIKFRRIFILKTKKVYLNQTFINAKII